MYYSTYQGLHDWYKHIFENLGWMILAKERKYKTKVKIYIESISHLHDALIEKYETTNDSDRKEDLWILLQNLLILEKKAKKLLSLK